METFTKRVNDAKEKGHSLIKITDNNHMDWNSGFAAWLMDNFDYRNTTTAFIANLNKPK